MITSVFVVAVLACATPAATAAPTDDVATMDIGALRLVPLAQLRVRGEVVPDRTLAGETPELVFTHRARLGARASLDLVDLVVRVQDVRAWGSERVPAGLPPDRTIYGAVPESLNLHEAYAGVHLGNVEARVGRQEIVIGNERLMGNADWLQRGRAFDAVRFLDDEGDVSWSLFAALVSSDADTFEVLSGAHLELVLAPWSKLSPILVNDARVADGGHITTAGARIDGAAGGLAYDVEAYGQTTQRTGAPITVATLLGARASYRFDTLLQPKVGIVTDVVSGSAGGAKPGPLAPFDTLFATNHKFYGFQDMFTALPLHTKGRGLVDNAVALWLVEGPWSFSSFVHVFTPLASDESSGGANDDAGVAVYGVEPDIVGSFKPTKNIALDLGCALFVPVGTSLGRGTRPAAWSYAQLNVQL